MEKAQDDTNSLVSSLEKAQDNTNSLVSSLEKAQDNTNSLVSYQIYFINMIRFLIELIFLS